MKDTRLLDSLSKVQITMMQTQILRQFSRRNTILETTLQWRIKFAGSSRRPSFLVQDPECLLKLHQ